MYRDNTLMPSEAVRLLALGLLAQNDRHYAELAGDVRHFIGRMVGPSLELVAQPLELLKVEGLVEAVAGEGMTDNALLRITEAGRQELHRQLTSNLRPQVNDLNKLIVALKVRFIEALPPAEQLIQIDLLIEIFERELVRLRDLRQHHATDGAALPGWLELEIAQTSARLTWFEGLRERLG
jgi:DNA-binding PadR family transcriptional regulator